jgi:hypothetical protein
MQNQKRPVALIAGITGQDGSYLVEFLLKKGYEVHGVIRRSSSLNTGRLDDIYQDPHEAAPKLKLHYGDMTDASVLRAIVGAAQPDEVYNLAAQSHVRVSYDAPVYTVEATAMGTIMLLEAIRDAGLKTRFYQASSGEIFGKMTDTKANAEKAFDLFRETYYDRYLTATRCLQTDREKLLTFHDFPAKHWTQLCTTHPIENIFSTLRLRHNKTRNHAGQQACLARVYRLSQGAQRGSTRINGSGLIQDFIPVFQYQDGVTKSAASSAPSTTFNSGPKFFVEMQISLTSW